MPNSFSTHLESSEKKAKQFEKAAYFLLKSGAKVAEIETMFGVDDLGKDVRDLQMARFYGWTLAEIEDMSERQYDRAYAYMSAMTNLMEK